jgi:hypothetical protein
MQFESTVKMFVATLPILSNSMHTPYSTFSDSDKLVRNENTDFKCRPRKTEARSNGMSYKCHNMSGHIYYSHDPEQSNLSEMWIISVFSDQTL